MPISSLFLAWFLLAANPAQFWKNEPEMFTPSRRLSAVGVDRRNMSDELIEARTRAMIDAQTFSILRDPRAVRGAERVTAPKMARLFSNAERQAGLPPGLVSAMAYLESFGDPKAESPTGPRGIMQISGGTARAMGLKIIYKTRYKITRQRRTVKNKRGKAVTRTVRVRTPYTVLVRDERMIPERAVPAAAQYTARIAAKFGGLDWAIFAYHCGEGCVMRMKAMTEDGESIRKPVTVAKMFFGTNPAWNKDLYEAVKAQMERDYSPTYWFRVRRAQELLDLFRRDPRKFRELAQSFRYELDPEQRAPHRLAVWLKRSDLVYQNCEDIRRDQGSRLREVLRNPRFFGFDARADLLGAQDPRNREAYMQASPAALGALLYISYETRRLHEAMRPRGEKFVPLEVTALVRPLDRTPGLNGRMRNEAAWHCTGQVFDLNTSRLPAGQREALLFVLGDLGWSGYLGFVQEDAGGDMHIGPAPSAREFFTAIFEEALAAAAKE